MDSLRDRFRAHLASARLFPRSGKAVVAVSGGLDSLALLDLLHDAASDLGLALIVAHADHGIQKGSGDVGKWVGGIAGRLQLPFEFGELHLGPGTSETEARTARYAWLRDVQKRHHARYLVTAHHADDQIETVLLRVLRGSGLSGLAGMSPRSRGGLVRPLLAFTRTELAAHVKASGVSPYDDPANADPKHLRSWVRTALLPLIDARLGSRVRDDLLRLARHASADRSAWDAVPELLPELELRASPYAFSVARIPLAGYDPALAIALLRVGARRAGLVLGPTRARRILALAAGPSGRRVELGSGWSAEAVFSRIQVSRDAVGVVTPEVAIGETGSADFGAYRFSWRVEPAPQLLERAGWTTWVAGPGCLVRSPQRGDRMAPLGGVGHRPVRRLLMEARVPRGSRGGYPVVARGETIVWVPGICRSVDELPRPGTPAVRLDVTEYDAAEADRGA
jgi:tRNA(Ile)-lysidine synthase